MSEECLPNSINSSTQAAPLDDSTETYILKKGTSELSNIEVCQLFIHFQYVVA